jgi:hypothetical protein
VTRTIGFLKDNVIALVALFIALGGTSYAAVAIPKDSVGSTQIRKGAVTSSKVHSGAITPGKLSSKSFGGRILYLAEIQSSGVVAESYPKGISTSDWSAYSGGFINFPRELPKGCLPIATGASTLTGVPSGEAPSIPVIGVGIEGNRRQAQVAVNGAAPFSLAIVCTG